jgi:hypothetical protein
MPRKPPTRGPGRPVLEHPRAFPVQVLLTEAERTLVHAAATRAGVSTSTWLRELALTNAAGVAP